MLIVENYTAGYTKDQFLFKDVSFELTPGQAIGVTGLNGSGKSTFIKGLLNFVPYKKGKIYLDGDDISNWSPATIFGKKSLAYLSQRNRVFKHLTIEEHIRLYRAYSKKKRPNSAEPLLYNLIQSHKYSLASTLSGGEQLILGLLCVAIINPDFVFLDEPSDSLDINYKERLLQILTSWKNDKGLLIVEQNTEIIKKITKNNLIINRLL